MNTRYIIERQSVSRYRQLQSAKKFHFNPSMFRAKKKIRRLQQRNEQKVKDTHTYKKLIKKNIEDFVYYVEERIPKLFLCDKVQTKFNCMKQVISMKWRIYSHFFLFLFAMAMMMTITASTFDEIKYSFVCCFFFSFVFFQ